MEYETRNADIVQTARVNTRSVTVVHQLTQVAIQLWSCGIPAISSKFKEPRQSELTGNKLLVSEEAPLSVRCCMSFKILLSLKVIRIYTFEQGVWKFLMLSILYLIWSKTLVENRDFSDGTAFYGTTHTCGKTVVNISQLFRRNWWALAHQVDLRIFKNKSCWTKSMADIRISRILFEFQFSAKLRLTL